MLEPHCYYVTTTLYRYTISISHFFSLERNAIWIVVSLLFSDSDNFLTRREEDIAPLSAFRERHKSCPGFHRGLLRKKEGAMEEEQNALLLALVGTTGNSSSCDMTSDEVLHSSIFLPPLYYCTA